MDTKGSLMLFSVHEFVFALEVGKLLEVSLVDPGRAISVGEGRFDRMLDYRGTQIPVVQLASEVSLSAPEVELLVVEGKCPLAIPIDSVMEVVSRKGAEFRFPGMLRTEKNRFIKAVYRYDKKMAFVIDPALILDDDDIGALRALQRG